MINGVHTLNVLVEVAEERHRQDEQWGLQDFPFHIAPCRELVMSGAPGDVDECGCQS